MAKIFDHVYPMQGDPKSGLVFLMQRKYLITFLFKIKPNPQLMPQQVVFVIR